MKFRRRGKILKYKPKKERELIDQEKDTDLKVTNKISLREEGSI